MVHLGGVKKDGDLTITFGWLLLFDCGDSCDFELRENGDFVVFVGDDDGGGSCAAGIAGDAVAL